MESDFRVHLLRVVRAGCSLFTGNNTGKRRSSWPSLFAEAKRAARFRAARREDEFRLIAGRLRRVLQTLQRVVERKTTRFLARRKFLERREELSDVLLRWHQDESVI